MTKRSRARLPAGLADEFDWPEITDRALRVVLAGPAASGIPLAALLDHHCLPLLSPTALRDDLWLWLVRESHRDPAGAVGLAMRRQREAALGWATARVLDYQRRGEIRFDLDADHIAATVLIEFEALAATLRLTPDLAHDAYLDTRERCLLWCSTGTMPR